MELPINTSFESPNKVITICFHSKSSSPIIDGEGGCGMLPRGQNSREDTMKIAPLAQRMAYNAGSGLASELRGALQLCYNNAVIICSPFTAMIVPGPAMCGPRLYFPVRPVIL